MDDRWTSRPNAIIPRTRFYPSLFDYSHPLLPSPLPSSLSLSLSFRFLSTFLSSSPPPTAVSLISRLSIYFVRLVRCPGPFLGWLCLTQRERERRRRAIPCWGDNEKRTTGRERKSTRGGRRSRRRRGKEEKKKEKRKERNMEGEKKREEKSVRKVLH